MNNKKGFTLVELLAVVILLALIVAIAVPAYGKISTNVKNQQFENKLELIKAAALKYADDTNYVAFYVQDLIDNGYLDPDVQGKIVDTNNDSINCYPIKVHDDTGILYADIERKNHISSDKCDNSYLVSFNEYITILANGNPLTSTSWFGEDIIKLRLSGKNGWQITENTLPMWYTGLISTSGRLASEFEIDPSTSVKNEIYRVKVSVTKGGETREIEAKFVVQIDKEEPYFKSSDERFNFNNSFARTRTYIPKGADNASGYYGSYFEPIVEYSSALTADNIAQMQSALNSSSNKLCSKTATYNNGKKEYTINKNGIYKVCLRDNVGNVTNSNPSADASTLKTTVFAVDHIDDLPPICDLSRPVRCSVNGGAQFDCSGSSASSSVWVNGNVTLSFPCIDVTQRTLSGDKSGSGCKKSAFSIVKNGNIGETEEISVQMSDKAGNNGTCKRSGIKINYDGTTPSFALKNQYGGTYRKSQNTTIEMTDTGSGFAAGDYTFKYAWGTSAQACSGMTKTVTIKITNNGSLKGTANIEVSKETGAYNLYVCNSAAISDRAGNSLAANTRQQIQMYLDNEKPTCDISGAPSSWQNTDATLSPATTIKDNHDGHVFYSWINNTSYVSTRQNYTADKNGTYTLYVKDGLGNENNCSVTISKIDKTKPSCTWNVWKPAGPLTQKGNTSNIKLTCTDSGSGIPATSKAAKLSNTKAGTISTPKVAGTDASRTYTYTLTAKAASNQSTSISMNDTIKDSAGNEATFTNNGPSITVDVLTGLDTVTIESDTCKSSDNDCSNNKCVCSIDNGYGLKILSTKTPLDKNYNYFKINVRAYFVKGSNSNPSFVCHIEGAATSAKCTSMKAGYPIGTGTQIAGSNLYENAPLGWNGCIDNSNQALQNVYNFSPSTISSSAVTYNQWKDYTFEFYVPNYNCKEINAGNNAMVVTPTKTGTANVKKFLRVRCAENGAGGAGVNIDKNHTKIYAAIIDSDAVPSTAKTISCGQT